MDEKRKLFVARSSQLAEGTLEEPRHQHPQATITHSLSLFC